MAPTQPSTAESWGELDDYYGDPGRYRDLAEFYGRSRKRTSPRKTVSPIKSTRTPARQSVTRQTPQRTRPAIVVSQNTQEEIELVHTAPQPTWSQLDYHGIPKIHGSPTRIMSRRITRDEIVESSDEEEKTNDPSDKYADDQIMQNKDAFDDSASDDSEADIDELHEAEIHVGRNQLPPDTPHGSESGRNQPHGLRRPVSADIVEAAGIHDQDDLVLAGDPAISDDVQEDLEESASNESDAEDSLERPQPRSNTIEIQSSLQDAQQDSMPQTSDESQNSGLKLANQPIGRIRAQLVGLQQPIPHSSSTGTGRSQASGDPSGSVLVPHTPFVSGSSVAIPETHARAVIELRSSQLEPPASGISYYDQSGRYQLDTQDQSSMATQPLRPVLSQQTILEQTSSPTLKRPGSPLGRASALSSSVKRHKTDRFSAGVSRQSPRSDKAPSIADSPDAAQHPANLRTPTNTAVRRVFTPTVVTAPAALTAIPSSNQAAFAGGVESPRQRHSPPQVSSKGVSTRSTPRQLLEVAERRSALQSPHKTVSATPATSPRSSAQPTRSFQLEAMSYTSARVDRAASHMTSTSNTSEGQTPSGRRKPIESSEVSSSFNHESTSATPQARSQKSGTEKALKSPLQLTKRSLPWLSDYDHELPRMAASQPNPERPRARQPTSAAIPPRNLTGSNEQYPKLQPSLEDDQSGEELEPILRTSSKRLQTREPSSSLLLVPLRSFSPLRRLAEASSMEYHRLVNGDLVSNGLLHLFCDFLDEHTSYVGGMKHLFMMIIWLMEENPAHDPVIDDSHWDDFIIREINEYEAYRQKCQRRMRQAGTWDVWWEQVDGKPKGWSRNVVSRERLERILDGEASWWDDKENDACWGLFSRHATKNGSIAV